MKNKWTKKADMPTARYFASSAVVDGKIYVIGGYDGQNEFSVVEEYDPATDTWTTRTNMPTPRDSSAAAAVGGRIYVIGGYNGQNVLSVVEQYDPATDTWTTRTNMPTPRGELVAAAVDGKIYVIGGANGLKGHMEMLLTVEVYDPATDMWTGKADIPTGRMATAVCVVDGRIYVAGGIPEWIPADRKEVFPCLSTVEVYDPATDTWTQSSDMPRARFVHYAGGMSGKMYIMGGADVRVHRKGEGYLIVDVYDPKTDTWTTAGDSPKLGARGAVAMMDGKIYIIGGNAAGPGSAVLSAVDEFTPGLSVVKSTAR